MNDTPLLMGLDLGSTNIKTVIYELDGTSIGRSSIPCPTHYPQAGWAHYDPDELWETCIRAMREAVGQVDHPERIAGIAVSSFGEAGVLMNGQGEPITDMIAWFDQRCRVQYERMVASADPDRLFAITGTTIQQIMTGPKIMWHQDNEPETYAKATSWLNSADYMAFRLSGVKAQSKSLASRSGIIDLRAGDWSDELLALAGIDRNLLPQVVDGGEPLGPVLPDVQAQTGLTANTLVAVGGHDHPCGAFAAGTIRHGDFLDSIGTTECTFLAIDQPLTDPAIGRQGYSMGAHARGSFYMYGGLYTAGICYDWFRSLAADQISHNELLSAASRVGAGSNGVMFLPHLRLSNTPFPDSRVRGAYVGLTMETDTATLMRSTFEGLAFEARSASEPLFAYAGLPLPSDCVVVGGTSRNRLLLQIKASVQHQSMHVLDLDEAGALGVAMLAGIAAGVYRDVDHAVDSIERPEHVIEPDSADHHVYDALFEKVYQQLYPRLRPYNHIIFDTFTGQQLQ
jgi:xylulokinase